MAVKPSSKAEAWALFDHIVAKAVPDGEHSNPWILGADGQLRFEPDYGTLERLLGVPLHLKAGTQSGVPALALDVWLSYEFRRADSGPTRSGRGRPIRILPAAVASPIASLPTDLRRKLAAGAARPGGGRSSISAMPPTS